MLCADIVNGANIQKNINVLQRNLDKCMDEDAKLSMSIVEMIKSTRQELNECIKRQQTLYKSLVQERSDKLNEDIKDKASLLNLINAWKNYEVRQNLLKLAKGKKEDLTKQLHEIDNMEELKQRVLGLSINEIVNG